MFNPKQDVQNSLLAKYIKMLLVSFRCSTWSKMYRILFWRNTLKCCLLVSDVQPEARCADHRADEQANPERQPIERTSEPGATAERTNKRTRSDRRADEQANPERQPSERTSEPRATAERTNKRTRATPTIFDNYSVRRKHVSSVLYMHM